MKKLTRTIAILVLASLLMLMLSSCSTAQDTTTVPAEPIVNEAAPIQAEPELIPLPNNSASQAEPEIIPMPDTSNDQFETGTAPEVESYATTGRPEGERFEGTIMMEGMEETVKYEHVVSKAAGIEMDYDYESFVRRSEADRERFVSTWDNAANPENYLEVTYSAESAEAAKASVSEALSKEYDLTEETRRLDRAGDCSWIEASVVKGTNNMAPQIQTVYIIPASDGCRIATIHCAIEGSEGFGRRFAYMLNTLSVISR